MAALAEYGIAREVRGVVVDSPISTVQQPGFGMPGNTAAVADGEEMLVIHPVVLPIFSVLVRATPAAG